MPCVRVLRSQLAEVRTDSCLRLNSTNGREDINDFGMGWDGMVATPHEGDRCDVRGDAAESDVAGFEFSVAEAFALVQEPRHVFPFLLSVIVCTPSCLLVCKREESGLEGRCREGLGHRNVTGSRDVASDV